MEPARREYGRAVRQEGQGARLRRGEYRQRVLEELAAYPDGVWVKGAEIRAKLGSATEVSTAMRRAVGLIETRMGQYGGYRLTARGRRLMQRGMEHA